MQIKLSKYISEFLVENGFTNIFSVVGGGSMHLNDAFGHQDGLHVTYHHHEQAAAMAAEAFFRVNNQMSCTCVTSGPGATNAITGCLCAYTDSIPVLFISGQVPRGNSAASTGTKVRFFGIQEVDIVSAVKSMTKYAVTVNEPLEIRYHLEKALQLARSGRPGPVWLDIPLDVQGAIIETVDLKKYHKQSQKNQHELEDEQILVKLLEKIQSSERPVIIAGNGIRLAGAHQEFLRLVSLLNIPVISCMSSIDVIESNNPLYIGRCGPTGTRAGNFAMQNCDFLFSIGSRLGISVTGFNFKAWARAAYKVMVNIDEEELKKKQIQIDLPICADAKLFITALTKVCKNKNLTKHTAWNKTCSKWKNNYPVVGQSHYDNDQKTNIYAFFNELSKEMLESSILVVSIGMVRVAGSQSVIIKKGQRFITNPTTASMGYCLPAAIGACIANGKQSVVCVTGDGSFQMNIQELQTIVQNKLPIKIFVINNEGYHSIRQTQNHYFNGNLVGVGNDSGDLSFPDLSKIACAYGITYYSCSKTHDLNSVITEVLTSQSSAICEVIVGLDQETQPKLSSRQLRDGRIVSQSLENMYPFLPLDELKANMLIPLWEEDIS